jgi:demethylmenaquinone methyltransferase/2-methoxy-6-polyprenyl-1,4-benzoquinol methylase
MSDSVTPYKNSSLDKKHQVAAMFNNIAWRYDFLNHFLSFGVDRYWRRQAINLLRNDQPKVILDIATGTADLAIEAMRLNPVKIFGVDISSDMIEIGKDKIRKKNVQDKIELIEADSENLFFDDNKFDAITVGFGVRNFGNLEKGLSEMLRVLKPGGIAIILEFSKPGNSFIRFLYNFYSTRICPLIGNAISKDKAAYSYLHESVEAFPDGKDFLNIFSSVGFGDVKWKPLTFGVASVYLGKKQAEK